MREYNKTIDVECPICKTATPCDWLWVAPGTEEFECYHCGATWLVRVEFEKRRGPTVEDKAPEKRWQVE